MSLTLKPLCFSFLSHLPNITYTPYSPLHIGLFYVPVTFSDLRLTILHFLCPPLHLLTLLWESRAPRISKSSWHRRKEMERWGGWNATVQQEKSPIKLSGTPLRGGDQSYDSKRVNFNCWPDTAWVIWERSLSWGTAQNELASGNVCGEFSQLLIDGIGQTHPGRWPWAVLGS